ncbi:retention module-containing protein, partial [Vibrio sp. TH_r3]|uniref:retention module-containing protein n=1 Tax=Vibrio sp. TH_r3 TaxID=3082084 RepID=UPI0029531133
MTEQILTQNAVVTSIVGDAILIRPGAAAQNVQSGMQLLANDILLTPDNAEVIVQINGQLVIVDKNCVSCLAPENYGEGTDKPLVVGPVGAELTVDTNAVDNQQLSFEGDDIAAIQQAILDGVDPTLALEAAAAGGPGVTSALGGFGTIDYTYAELLASTYFQTQGFNNTETEEDEDRNLLLPGQGGENASVLLTEGDIGSATGVSSSVITTVVEAGTRPLDPTTFGFEPEQLAAVLAELNNEITSSGEAVEFRFDEESNSIIGVQGDVTVVTITLDINSVGSNVELSLTTTLEQPIDHNVSQGNTGLVRFADDTLSIDLSIQGQDVNGNDLVNPVILTPVIVDGSNQAAIDVDIEYTETTDLSIDNPATFEGAVFDIGSDYLESVTFDASILDLFSDVSSNNNELIAVLSDDGTTLTVYVDGDPDNVVLDASINLDGTYLINQYQSIEQVDGNNDQILFDLPVTSTDFDGDVVTGTISYTINDGQNASVVNNDTSVVLTETTTLVDNPISSTSSPHFEAGTDVIESVEWVISAETKILLDNLTTNDKPTSWSLSDDGKTITVVRESDGKEVLSLTIDDLTGQYTVTQSLPIDQDVEATDGDADGSAESISLSDLNLTLKATDSDGDETLANTTVSVL